MALHEAADNAWREAFFGECDICTESLVARETARFKAAQNLMAMRRSFLPIRKSVPQVAWDIARPAELQDRHGLRLEVEAAAFPAPAPVDVERSRSISGARGEEFWIRMISPATATGDVAWARVFMPVQHPARGGGDFIAWGIHGAGNVATGGSVRRAG